MSPDQPPIPTLEETIVVPPGWQESTNASQPHGHVEFVAGSGPRLESETESLLRGRLRAAAMVLLAGAVAFFVRDLFLQDAPALWFRVLTLAGVSGMAAVLGAPVAFTLRKLRRFEVTLFGLTAFFLGAYQYQVVLVKANEGNPAFELAAIKSFMLYFFAVILLYGTFIPNTWQRAARVLTPIAVVPFIVMALLRIRSLEVEHMAREIANFEQVSDNIIMMGLGLASTLYGTHIINTLRVEAFKARQMGQYHLKERIGAGGMGEVYLAEHSLLKRPCAIKLIHPGSQADPQALARFEREVRTTAKLTHWNTVEVFDYGRTDDGTFYYVMEFLPGMSLHDLVRRFGPLPAARVIHLLRQTCHALREAHGMGLIHRDIKPANLFVARLGGVCDVVKLLDFGLVKHAGEAHNSELSQEGTFSGSPLYMSPEQFTAIREVGPRSDIYSLGATAYYALCRKVPFDGANAIQVMIAHARDPVVPPSTILASVPADVEQVILRCLAKAPGDRFQNVDELEQALLACADAGGWNDKEAARWWSEIGGTPKETATVSGASDSTGDVLQTSTVS